MDINVNTHAFTKGINDLKSHCRNIDYLGRALIHNMKIANEDFNDINFDRAYEVVSDVLRSFNNFYSSVDAIEKAMKKLNNCVEEYSNATYKG